jgi:hypothetical protein
MTAGRGFPHRPLHPRPSRSRHVSCFIPGSNCVDERLVPLGVRTLRHRQRLTLCGLGEGLRPHVRNPDLNGTKPRLPQSGAMRADAPPS